MKRAFQFLDIQLGEQKLDQVIAVNSFEAMSGRRQGQENTRSFHRKGVSGEWREVFSDAQKRKFSQQAGDVLETLGYTSDS